MCFVIAACGFVPLFALDEFDNALVRFEKILDLIVACDLSVHDVSRVELDAVSALPRFKMPLELGADLGLRLRGPAVHRRRRILVLDAVAHRYGQTLSDISGIDIEARGNDAARLIKLVRDWLNAGRDEAMPLPGASAIAADYKSFQPLVLGIIAELRLGTFYPLPHVDYMHLVETALP